MQVFRVQFRPAESETLGRPDILLCFLPVDSGISLSLKTTSLETGEVGIESLFGWFIQFSENESPEL